jgi:hypothetical protein
MLTSGAARLSQPDPSPRDCAGRVGEQVFSQFSPFAIFQMDDVISGWNRGDGAPLAFATISKDQRHVAANFPMSVAHLYV